MPKGIRELATLALATGMRLDETTHLHCADVDIERRLITVHRGWQGTVKSGRVRRVPILDSVLPMLRELALQRGGATLVFPGKNGKPRTKVGVRVPFKQAALHAGLSSNLRFHDLRHTFAVVYGTTRRKRYPATSDRGRLRERAAVELRAV